MATSTILARKVIEFDFINTRIESRPRTLMKPVARHRFMAPFANAVTENATTKIFPFIGVQ